MKFDIYDNKELKQSSQSPRRPSHWLSIYRSWDFTCTFYNLLFFLACISAKPKPKSASFFCNFFFFCFLANIVIISFPLARNSYRQYTGTLKPSQISFLCLLFVKTKIADRLGRNLLIAIVERWKSHKFYHHSAVKSLSPTKTTF